MPLAAWLACIKGLHLAGATSSPSSHGVNVNGLIMTNGSSLAGSSLAFFSLSFLDASTLEIHNGTTSARTRRHDRIHVYWEVYTRVMSCRNRAYAARKKKPRVKGKQIERNHQRKALWILCKIVIYLRRLGPTLVYSCVYLTYSDAHKKRKPIPISSCSLCARRSARSAAGPVRTDGRAKRSGAGTWTETGRIFVQLACTALQNLLPM